ncbi:MAG TPA: histidine phosphatase family protein, partial [Thermomicrobiales bacterium]|nr:histidine phosphatase family protein [Thermomicrobiales bacterium]
MTTILFVRHTEVENPDGLLYGRLPGFRLSDAGRRHAERVAGAIAGRDIAAIYSSPLLRARQTAAIIA